MSLFKPGLIPLDSIVPLFAPVIGGASAPLYEIFITTTHRVSLLVHFVTVIIRASIDPDPSLGLPPVMAKLQKSFVTQMQSALTRAHDAFSESTFNRDRNALSRVKFLNIFHISTAQREHSALNRNTFLKAEEKINFQRKGMRVSVMSFNLIHFWSKCSTSFYGVSVQNCNCKGQSFNN
jgi:hypothetical protein